MCSTLSTLRDLHLIYERGTKQKFSRERGEVIVDKFEVVEQWHVFKRILIYTGQTISIHLPEIEMNTVSGFKFAFAFWLTSKYSMKRTVLVDFLVHETFPSVWPVSDDYLKF